MALTHPNFKSVIPGFNDAESMDDYVGTAISYQYMFDKRTPPWEMSLWGKDKLNNFQVDLEMVDRLYYIKYSTDVGGSEYYIMCRMDYGGKGVYIELEANCDFTGFDCQGGGTIFISTDANIFMNITMKNKYPLHLIYQSLLEDGIHITEFIEYDNISKMLYHDAPMLKYLCHMTIWQHKESLLHYRDVLPIILRDSIDDFIKLQEAKEHYES